MSKKTINSERKSGHIEKTAVLNCKNQAATETQIKALKNLLNELDKRHPEILLEYGINPDDYKGKLLYRSAVESIRGSFISSSTKKRQEFVENVLVNLKDRKLINGFKKFADKARWDFEVYTETNDSCIIEVKGGEGNSINISDRPNNAKEFAIWSHLDGSIQHPPSKSVRAIIGRITKEFSAKSKQVDMLIIKDKLCGTLARPCPKYVEDGSLSPQSICPDIFLFPQNAPSESEPEPPVHDLTTLRLPKLILQYYNVPPEDYEKHIWYVRIKRVADPADSESLNRTYIIHQASGMLQTGVGKKFRML